MALDIAAFKKVFETVDTEAIVGFYADDVEHVEIDAEAPPRAPRGYRTAQLAQLELCKVDNPDSTEGTRLLRGGGRGAVRRRRAESGFLRRADSTQLAVGQTQRRPILAA